MSATTLLEYQTVQSTRKLSAKLLNVVFYYQGKNRYGWAKFMATTATLTQDEI